MRVLWIDVCNRDASDSSSGIAWLRQRMENMSIGSQPVEIMEHAWQPGVLPVSSSHQHQLQERIDDGIERIVIASCNRLDYPTELIELLRHLCPEVPLALACDSWWDGWRRSGLKSRNHLSLPWYRWWDGWVDWLQGRTPQLYEPIPAESSLLADKPLVDSSVAQRSPARGLIVANCRQTSAAWSLAAATAGYSAECMSARAFQQHFPNPTTPTRHRAECTPRWILWDDTCLDTMPNVKCRDLLAAQPEESELREFLERLPRLPPTELPTISSERILGIVAVSLPRADWALSLCSVPGCELLAKPNSGQGLTRLLERYFSV